jgi:hypothetical protein
VLNHAHLPAQVSRQMWSHDANHSKNHPESHCVTIPECLQTPSNLSIPFTRRHICIAKSTPSHDLPHNLISTYI